MKKIVVRSVALLSVIGSGLSFAQDKVEEPKKEEVKAEAPKGDALKIEEAPVVKTVVPYGLVQSYLNLAESERQNTPDFKLLFARFGLKASEGIARAQIEAALNGNAKPKDPGTTGTPNTVTVRRADLGLALPSGTTVSLGRVRIGGADAWGVDATTSPSQFGPTDGLLISQKIVVSEGNDVTISATYGNSTSIANGRTFAPGKNTFMGENSPKQEKGMVVGIKASVEGVKAAVFYGMEKSQLRTSKEIKAVKAVTEVKDGNGVVTTPAVAEVKASETLEAGDVTHVEANLGYTADHIGAGVWFEQESVSKLKAVTKNEAGKLTLGAESGAKSTDTLMGIGFNGDSMQFGMGDFLQKGDSLTYGASYTVTNNRVAGGVVADEKKADVSTIGIGGGYSVGGLALELNVALASTGGDKAYANSKGKGGNDGEAADKELGLKSHSSVYLVGAYAF